MIIKYNFTLSFKKKKIPISASYNKRPHRTVAKKQIDS